MAHALLPIFEDSQLVDEVDTLSNRTKGQDSVLVYGMRLFYSQKHRYIMIPGKKPASAIPRNILTTMSPS
jgi:hypothetical protein